MVRVDSLEDEKPVGNAIENLSKFLSCIHFFGLSSWSVVGCCSRNDDIFEIVYPKSNIHKSVYSLFSVVAAIQPEYFPTSIANS